MLYSIFYDFVKSWRLIIFYLPLTACGCATRVCCRWNFPAAVDRYLSLFRLRFRVRHRSRGSDSSEGVISASDIDLFSHPCVWVLTITTIRTRVWLRILTLRDRWSGRAGLQGVRVCEIAVRRKINGDTNAFAFDATGKTFKIHVLCMCVRALNNGVPRIQWKRDVGMPHAGLACIDF